MFSSYTLPRVGTKGGSRGQTAIYHFSCSTEEGRDGDGAGKGAGKRYHERASGAEKGTSLINRARIAMLERKERSSEGGYEPITSDVPSLKEPVLSRVVS